MDTGSAARVAQGKDDEMNGIIIRRGELLLFLCSPKAKTSLSCRGIKNIGFLFFLSFFLLASSAHQGCQSLLGKNYPNSFKYTN
jgi:hypothetical protein